MTERSQAMLILPEEYDFLDRTSAELRAEFGRARELYEGVMRLIPSQITVKNGVPKAVTKVVFSLLAKATKTFRAAELVSQVGLGQDALVLVRVLFETGTAVNYIL